MKSPSYLLEMIGQRAHIIIRSEITKIDGGTKLIRESMTIIIGIYNSHNKYYGILLFMSPITTSVVCLSKATNGKDSNLYALIISNRMQPLILSTVTREHPSVVFLWYSVIAIKL